MGERLRGWRALWTLSASAAVAEEANVAVAEEFAIRDLQLAAVRKLLGRLWFVVFASLTQDEKGAWRPHNSPSGATPQCQ